MYITLTDIQNGAYSQLNPCIDNRDGAFEISLAGITYYNKFQNIFAELDNNKFRYGKDEKDDYIIADGYYNVCDLNKHYFEPLKIPLHVNPATGLVTIVGIKKLLRLYDLGVMLGFKGEDILNDVPKPGLSMDDTVNLYFDNNYEFSPPPFNATGTELPTLAYFKELSVHLDNGLDTFQNLHNGFPSTVLHTLSVGEEKCNAGAKGEVALVKRQWKALSSGTLAGLTISVRDISGKLLPFAYLSVVLEVRNKKR